MRASWLLGLVVVAAVSPLANAYITDITAAADGDGAITCTSSWEWTTEDMTQANLSITETMFRSPGHVEGSVATNDLQDPTIWILKTVENATGVAWTGYHFNIFMDQAFSIQGVILPTGWSFGITTPATGSGPFADAHGRTWANWMALDFTSMESAYSILDGSSGDFGVRLNFTGPVSFEVEQAYVPEPISFALLALGGLFLRRRR